jgi:hypothetical protein
MIYTEVTIIELFIFVYAIMSPERLKLVYRCALIVDILLSAIFIVLSGIALDQQETFFHKMVELGAILYLYLAVFVPGITISITPKSIINRFQVIYTVFFMVTSGGLILYLIIIIQPEYSGPLFIPMTVSAVHLLLFTTVLLETKGIDDSHWKDVPESCCT